MTRDKLLEALMTLPARSLASIYCRPQHTLSINNGAAEIVVQEVAADTGVFAVMRDSLTTENRNWLLFDVRESSSDVVNEDTNSDFYDCFRLSMSVRVGECSLSTRYYIAPSVEALQAAAASIRFTAAGSEDL